MMMSELNKILCNVTNVKLNYQDRKILILDWYVQMEDGGTFSAMNLVLDTYDKKLERRVGTTYGCEMIRLTLDFFGVDNLSDVKDYKCYLLTDKDRIWSASDVLGFQQLGFSQYSKNTQTLIKKDVYDQFVTCVED